MLNTISHNQHRMIIQTVLVLLLLLFGLAGVHLAVAQAPEPAAGTEIDSDLGTDDLSAASKNDLVEGPAFTVANVVTSALDSGPGTLRQAMLDASNGDVITFDPTVFPPDSPATIALSSAPLPDITQGNLTIDGSNAGVILDGSGLSSGNGFLIKSDNNLVDDLQILHFPDDGVRITIGSSHNTVANSVIGGNMNGISISGSGAISNTVKGSRIGTNATGTGALSNIVAGVAIHEGASFNIVGGSSPEDRNLVSGNKGSGIDISDSHSNVVSGNYIGTNINVTAALPNGQWGISILSGASHNLIGGDTAADRNIISGNVSDGVGILGAGSDYNVISGNYIGTDISGSKAIPNAGQGVYILDGPEHNGCPQYTSVGGTTPGQRNLVSGNGGGIGIVGTGCDYNIVVGNYIGTDASGKSALGNGNGPGVGIGEGAAYNIVGGDTPDERNLISGNSQGIGLSDQSHHNTIIGNFIGTDVDGLAALPNGDWGIWMDYSAHHNVIGGSNGTSDGKCSGECNLISGSIVIGPIGSEYNTVIGNYIGTDVSGKQPIGNHQVGVSVGSNNNTIGPRNVIAFSQQVGIEVGTYAVNNRITENSIHSSVQQGIKLNALANNDVKPPVVSEIDPGTGAIEGTACVSCTVELFSDDGDEGKVFEGYAIAGANGEWTYPIITSLTGPYLTATATDPDGNTSEFSPPQDAHPTPIDPLEVLGIKPAQGRGDVPNLVDVIGRGFLKGAAASLGDTTLDTSNVISTQLRAVVPAGLTAGVYDVTVENTDGISATLPNAYTVLSGSDEDLYAQSHELWTDPGAPRAQVEAKIGLVVHRLGDKNVLPSVKVRFYLGDPDAKGTVLGDGMIPLLSPGSSASTSTVAWTPPDNGTYEIYALIDPDDAVTEGFEDNNVVSRTITVLSAAPDQIAPHVDAFDINDGAVETDKVTVTLNTIASDPAPSSGVATLLYLEYEYSQASGQFVPVQESGWMTYATSSSDYTWELTPSAGVKYLQAWAADGAGNISLFPYSDSINYVPPTMTILPDQGRIYRYSVTAGQQVTARLISISGDTDLYVWAPDHETRPPWVSNLSEGIDQVTFNAPVDGVYQVEVYGYTSAEDQLTAEYLLQVVVASAGASAAQLHPGARTDKSVLDRPLVPIASEPGNRIGLPAAPTTAEPNRSIFLPALQQ